MGGRFSAQKVVLHGEDSRPPHHAARRKTATEAVTWRCSQKIKRHHHFLRVVLMFLLYIVIFWWVFVMLNGQVIFDWWFGLLVWAICARREPHRPSVVFFTNHSYTANVAVWTRVKFVASTRFCRESCRPATAPQEASGRARGRSGRGADGRSISKSRDHLVRSFDDKVTLWWLLYSFIINKPYDHIYIYIFIYLFIYLFISWPMTQKIMI